MKHLKSLLLMLLSIVLLLATGCAAEKLPDGTALNGVSLAEYAIVYSDTDVDYSYRAAQ